MRPHVTPRSILILLVGLSLAAIARAEPADDSPSKAFPAVSAAPAPSAAAAGLVASNVPESLAPAPEIALDRLPPNIRPVAERTGPTWMRAAGAGDATLDQVELIQNPEAGNEADNAAEAATLLDVFPAPAANLTVLSATAADLDVQSGGAIELTWKVRNIGNGATGNVLLWRSLTGEALDYHSAAEAPGCPQVEAHDGVPGHCFAYGSTGSDTVLAFAETVVSNCPERFLWRGGSRTRVSAFNNLFHGITWFNTFTFVAMDEGYPPVPAFGT